MNTISRKRIDRLVPQAIEIIKEVEIPGENGRVSNSYHGYISSFGASMVQSSALAAAIFFEDSSGSQEDRSKVTEAILKLMLWEKEATAGSSRLSQYIIDNMAGGQVKNSTITDILASAIALKLALRTFKKAENNG